MSSLWALTRKELRVLLLSPVAYVVAGMFLILMGYLYFNAVSYFTLISVQAGQMPMVTRPNLTRDVFLPTYGNMGVVLIFLLPLLTMRLFAEERRAKTLELLMTSPIGILQMVLGKYLAVLILYVGLLACTVYMPLFMAAYGELSWGPVLTSYLGLLLLGSAALALGVFASSLTENQVIAAAVAFGGLLLLWVIGWISHSAGPGLGAFLTSLSLIEHLDRFLRGLLDTRDVVYYLSVTAFFLFLTHRVVESHRWR